MFLHASLEMNQFKSSSRDHTVLRVFLHSYAATMDGAEACICLYNISYQHFQLVFLDLESGFQCAFLPTEVPPSLVEAMTKANP